MLNFTANLSFLFQEMPMSERYAAAAASGFRAVEFMFPQGLGKERVAKALSDAGVELQLFNMRAGDWAGGERGTAALADREDEFFAAVEEAIEYAAALGVPRVNCHSGLVFADEKRAEEIMVERLIVAADRFAKHGLTLVVENINTYDMPGFLLSTPNKVFRILDRIKRDNVKLLYDIYHAQRMQGELVNTLLANIDRIGHIQVADNPGRNQPGTGEINYPFVFRKIEESGYAGWIGLEYIPASDTVASFGWLKQPL